MMQSGILACVSGKPGIPMKKDFSKNKRIELPQGSKVIACEVFRDELESFGIDQSHCLFLDQGLHRYPEDLQKRLEEGIARIEASCSPKRIVLVYGYCGGGLESIRTTRADLIIPKVHDCIPLLLGRKPDGIGPTGKGVFYLSRGWVKYGKNPYTEYLELEKKFGHEDAFWSCKELLKEYDTVSFIHTVSDCCPTLRSKSKEFADFFGMRHVEVPGNLRLLKSLLEAEMNQHIIKRDPGCRVSRRDFE
jgi:hypothetical protein